MMKHKDGKPINPNDKKSKVVPTAIMFIALCGFSFYLGRIFCSEKERFEAAEVTKKAVESVRETAVTPLQTKPVSFPECSIDYQDYTPCTDPKVLVVINFVI